MVDTASGILLGTPQYMSPDQLNGEAASAAWDIWALGVIAYEMLTGAHPFPATSVGHMQHSIVNGRFTSLSTHLREAPAEWQQFFERALNPKITSRPLSARDFGSALAKVLAVGG
jgi:eukaryotic-like serine/threonine-protein kinase